MPLITSISGIRGTIGGSTNDSLNPLNIVNFVAAFAKWINKTAKNKPVVVVGRDARISGAMLDQLVCGTLMACGIDVINIGLATTPTTEIAVIQEKAAGGIILTASHNPKNWNALKLLNSKGEFVDKATGEFIFETAKNSENFSFVEVDKIGEIIYNNEYVNLHIDLIKKLKLVDIKAIEQANFTVVVDCINSVGAIAIPQLLRELGVKKVIELNNIPNGDFAHNPEPLPENLTQIMSSIVDNKADIGIVVDPDVDRLAFVEESGNFFGEEYTLVAVSDYILQNKCGNTVSNMSSSRALADLTRTYGCDYFAAAVGELNVVEKMKEVNAIIGGEGNGGVIYPELHYGRDALVGVALFLSHLAKSKCTMSELRKKYPDYSMIKIKKEVQFSRVDKILETVYENFKQYNPSTIDGVKIDFPEGWVHLRRSNTEPIVRIYAEAQTEQIATELANMVISKINL